MKTLLKKTALIWLFVLTVVCVGLFAACGDTTENNEQPITYTVVVEDDSHTPVENVAVYWSKGSTRYDAVRTGADGKATMELPADTYSITLVASTLPDGYHAPENIQVTKDSATKTVTLVKDFRYVVNLVKEDGTPFYQENVMVAICQLEGSCLTPSPVGTDGKWSISDVEPGDYKVQITFPSAIADKYTYKGYTATNHYYTGEYFSATDTEMTIVIKEVSIAKTEYTVTVLKDDNKPATGVYVNLASSTASFTPAQTGADGKAKIEVPAYGEYSVTVNAPEGFTYDSGAYKTTAANHEITVKIHELNTLAFTTEMTQTEIDAYGANFSQFEDNELPAYSYKNDFKASETKYFTFTAFKSGYYVIYCKQANTTFKVCAAGTIQNYTDGEAYTVEGNLAQGITANEGGKVYFSVTSATAGELEFVIATPDPTPDSTVLNLTEAGTYEVTVINAKKYATVTFSPEATGVYEITSKGDFDTLVEYYASSYSTSFKTDEDDNSGEGNNFKYGGIEIQQVGPTMLFRVFVKDGATFPATFNIKITRTGDAQPIVERVPQTMTPAELGEQAYGEGSGVFTAIDLSETHTFVKGADGFYHVGTVEGPVLVAKLASSFRSLGTLTNEFGTGFYMYLIDMSNETVAWDYLSFIGAYAEKCNTDGVYGVNDEIKLMLERWATNYIDEHTLGIDSLGTILEGNEWLIPCGYYSAGSTPPVEADVIIGEYIDENEQTLKVLVTGSYEITAAMGPVESGTWAKNSENNYTFICPAYDVTYTVTRDLQGTLTFKDDADDSGEPFYVFEVASDDPGEKDVIVGDYIFESVGGNKYLSVNEDGTYTIITDMANLSGTWEKNENGSYTFTENNETWGEIPYIVTRDGETGKLAFYDLEMDPNMENPEHEFDVDAGGEEPEEQDAILGLYTSEANNINVFEDGTYEIYDSDWESLIESGTWSNNSGEYYFYSNLDKVYSVTLDENGKLTLVNIDTDETVYEAVKFVRS